MHAADAALTFLISITFSSDGLSAPDLPPIVVTRRQLVLGVRSAAQVQPGPEDDNPMCIVYEHRHPSLFTCIVPPEVMEQRTRLRDWEVGLMLSKDHQGVPVTLTECKSRFTFLPRVANKQAKLVSQAIIGLLQWVPALESLTAANGKEFAPHRHIPHTLSVDFYFAHPYASWKEAPMKRRMV